MDTFSKVILSINVTAWALNENETDKRETMKHDQ
jgi:hypothetical protein